MMINGDVVNDSASHKERGSFVNYVLEKMARNRQTA